MFRGKDKSKILMIIRRREAVLIQHDILHDQYSMIINNIFFQLIFSILHDILIDKIFVNSFFRVMNYFLNTLLYKKIKIEL